MLNRPVELPRTLRLQVDVVDERIVGRLGSGFEREAQQVRSSPAEPSERLVPLGVDGLQEAPIHDRVGQQPTMLDIIVDVVTLAARRQGYELDRAAGDWPGYIAAELDHRVAIGLEEIVVVNGKAGR